MVALITWLVVYILILMTLREASRPFRNRTWFKVLFLPGTLLAVVVQSVAAYLALSPRVKVSLLGDRKPAFALQSEKLPCLSGALFVLVKHLLFYILVVVGLVQMESRGLLEIRSMALPTLYPQKILTAHIDFNFGDYTEGSL